MTTPEPQEPDDFFAALMRPLPWHKAGYYACWRKWNALRRIPREIRWFWQRGRRGWADCDIWSFSHYLSRVVAEGVDSLREQVHGHPNDACTTCPSGWEHRPNCDGMERWEAVLAEISAGFRAAQDPLDTHDFTTPYVEETTEERAARLKTRDRGFFLFTEKFDSLWD